MRIILSRKGFDSSCGGCASPILPDGTMLSMPIPSDGDVCGYDEIHYAGKSYADIWRELNPTGIHCSRCHLDPDIRTGIRDNPKEWVPAVGQVNLWMQPVEISFEGPNEWWNLYPAAFGEEHQAGIHGAGSTASQLF